MKILSNEILRICKFAVVGGVGTLVDFSLFTLMGLYMSDSLHLLMRFISYSAAIPVAFILNNLWTFRDRQNFSSAALLKFIAINIFAMSGALGVQYVMKDLCGFNIYASWLGGSIGAFWFKFFGTKQWIFPAAKEGLQYESTLEAHSTADSSRIEVEKTADKFHDALSKK